MNMRFQKIAGSRQIVIDDASDLRLVPELDPALWAVTSLPTDTLVTDKAFLSYLDFDKNGRIRPSDINTAVKWIFSVLKNDEGITARSSSLKLDAINQENPEGALIYAAAKRILGNLNLPDATEITQEQAAEKKNIISNTLCNGDGVIPAESVSDPKIAEFVKDVAAIFGTVPDLVGLQGINKDILDRFSAVAAAARDWFIREENESELRPFDDQTDRIFQIWRKTHDKITEFFTICSALAGADDKRIDGVLKLDPMDPEAASAFLKKAPAAAPNEECTLDLNRWINPLWKTDLQNLLSVLFEMDKSADAKKLTLAEWEDLNLKLNAREQWFSKKPNDLDTKLSRERIMEIFNNHYIEETDTLIKNDQGTCNEIQAFEALNKLILFQRYLLTFTNNCVALPSLFDPAEKSIAQPGLLIMDGRKFTLITKITNLNEHKKIINRSNICVMYIELTAGTKKEASNLPNKINIAVAITSGSMRNIFIGKTGVFIGEDGAEWDAKVIDFVQQPVSLSEAFVMPFYKIGEFTQKQADKFFSTQSKSMENNIAKTVDENAKKDITKVIPAGKVQTPAVSGSMMLMGGGLGLAALGSSVAFIANTLKTISVWNVISVLFGIVIVISAPIIFVSIMKLMNRNVSDFYAASLWAVNPKMKISNKMGRIFTQKPAIPLKALLLSSDLISMIAKEYDLKEHKKRHKLLIFLIVILLITAAASVYLRFFKKPAAGKTIPKKIESEFKNKSTLQQIKK